MTLMKYANNKKQLKTIILIFFIVIIYILLNNKLHRSICIFYNITGVPCPGCGMTRSFMSLLKLDFKSSFNYHPLFPLVFFLPFLIIRKNTKLIFLFCSVFIIVWMIRLVFYFPHTEPMTYNYNCLFYKFKTLIISIK
jgi:hypothetical protein